MSSGMVFSLVSRMSELSTTGLPSFPTERRERGTVLCYYSCISIEWLLVLMNVPNGLIILLLSRSRFKEPILANVDSTLGLGNPNDWITHLGVRLAFVPLALSFVRTFVTQLFIILGTSMPLDSATPDQRSLVTLFPYRCFLR